MFFLSNEPYFEATLDSEQFTKIQVPRLTALLFSFCIFAPSFLFAQSLELSIPSEELPSDISTWENNPALIRLSLVAPEGIKLLRAHLVFEVMEGIEHVLVSTWTKYASQPSFSGTFKKKSFKFADIIGTSFEVDSSIRSDSSVIGKLQEGKYSICFYLVDSSGLQIGNISQGCSTFSIRDIDSPILLTPQNESTYDGKTPIVFTWTPAKVFSQTVHYNFKIYPIYDGQTPEQAMASTSAYYASDDIFSASLTYPSDAPPLNVFPKAKGFTWIVTQIDQNGKPIGKNYGRSIPSVFLNPTKGK